MGHSIYGSQFLLVFSAYSCMKFVCILNHFKKQLFFCHVCLLVSRTLSFVSCPPAALPHSHMTGTHASMHTPLHTHCTPPHTHTHHTRTHTHTHTHHTHTSHHTSHTVTHKHITHIHITHKHITHCDTQTHHTHTHITHCDTQTHHTHTELINVSMICIYIDIYLYFLCFVDSRCRM